MAKRAISNNWCDGKEFIAGKIYTDKECEGMDPRDFETISVDKEVEIEKKEEVKQEESPKEPEVAPEKEAEAPLDDSNNEVKSEEDAPVAPTRARRGRPAKAK